MTAQRVASEVVEEIGGQNILENSRCKPIPTRYAALAIANEFMPNRKIATATAASDPPEDCTPICDVFTIAAPMRREMAKAHLPTARSVLDDYHQRVSEQIAADRFNAADLNADDPRLSWIERQGGRRHVDRCLSFAVWFCQRLVDSAAGGGGKVTGALALGRTPTDHVFGGGPFLAHWSEDNRLTLALDHDCFWHEPLGAETLSILVHEAAHARNMHHGKGFHHEVERLAGVAAHIMFEHGEVVRRRWPNLIQADGCGQAAIAGRTRPSLSAWLLNAFGNRRKHDPLRVRGRPTV